MTFCAPAKSKSAVASLMPVFVLRDDAIVAQRQERSLSGAASVSLATRFLRELDTVWRARGYAVALMGDLQDDPGGVARLPLSGQICRTIGELEHDFLALASPAETAPDVGWANSLEVLVPSCPREQTGSEEVQGWSRTQVEAVAAAIVESANSLALSRPLYGLVLCGGKSRRMGRDKALLSFSEGSTQLERTARLLGATCDAVFCSARSEQAEAYAVLGGVPVIPDVFLDAGPLGGLLSAMRSHPHAAWLVVAVDLPRLDLCCLSRLLQEREPLRFATVYRSQDQAFLEPLCAVYEPKFLPAGLAALGLGMTCPGRVLESLRIKEAHQQSSSAALANVNTPVDYEQVRRDMLCGFSEGGSQ